MELNNQIVLRPRFKETVKLPLEEVVKRFVDQKTKQSRYKIVYFDEHIFIKLPRKEQHFWSPQLHLELNKDEEKTSIHGFFGPNPSVWTLFMFTHLILATAFLGLIVWAYTQYNLGNSYFWQVFLMILIVFFWVVLYFGGRLGRMKGRPDMEAMFQFYQKTLGVAG